MVETITAEDYASSLQTNSSMTILLLAITVIALGFGVSFAFIVANTIRKPVQQLVDASLQMQQGNLAVADTITYESKDEIGALAASLRETMRFLNAYVAEIGKTLRGDRQDQQDH